LGPAIQLPPELDINLGIGLTGSGVHRSAVGITVFGELPTQFPVTIPLANPAVDPKPGTVNFFYFNTGPGPFTCQATAGSVTLTAVGAVGEKVEGTYAFTGVGGANCPTAASLSGSFSVIRDLFP
jgi:hypothetical protein